jgi:hypothetical protein
MMRDTWDVLKWEDLMTATTESRGLWLTFRFEWFVGGAPGTLGFRVSLNQPQPRPDEMYTSLRQKANMTYSREEPFKALCGMYHRAMRDP